MSEDAVAIWRRFDEEVGDALLRAVSGAFAFVACADAHLADAEVDRFLAWVAEQDAFEKLPADRLEGHFRGLADAFAKDFAEGERRATASVSAVSDDPRARELVLSAARVAVVADERLMEVEEAAVARVRAALGLPTEGDLG
ncbi:MAG: TerB family tellurite resistance protein [Myxococcota bacterium]|nr:TerB family tellurite resistance protein [Myxococcota bacterium]